MSSAIWLIAAALAAPMNQPAAPHELRRFEFSQPLMGMPFDIRLYARTEEAANAAASAAFRRIRQLNGIFSDYNPDSELRRLCATAGSGRAVVASPELIDILQRSKTLTGKTGGRFDVSVGPLVALWRQARKSKQLPAPDKLKTARELVGSDSILIDARARTIELQKSGMQLDLGGIAVGYAIDEALKVLKSHGIEAAMIDGSGDVGTLGAPPGKPGWVIGVVPLKPDDPPSAYLVLKDLAVTTSGDAYQFIEIQGERYSHIVDPETGLGLTVRRSATVVARDCTTADSYATALSLLGPDEGLRLIDDLPGAAALVLTVTEGKVVPRESERWADLRR